MAVIVVVSCDNLIPRTRAAVGHNLVGQPVAVLSSSSCSWKIISLEDLLI